MHLGHRQSFSEGGDGPSGGSRPTSGLLWAVLQAVCAGPRATGLRHRPAGHLGDLGAVRRQSTESSFIPSPIALYRAYEYCQCLDAMAIWGCTKASWASSPPTHIRVCRVHGAKCNARKWANLPNAYQAKKQEKSDVRLPSFAYCLSSVAGPNCMSTLYSGLRYTAVVRVLKLPDWVILPIVVLSLTLILRWLWIWNAERISIRIARLAIRVLIHIGTSLKNVTMFRGGG